MYAPPENQTFEARTESSRAARRFVEHWLDAEGLERFADRVPLAVSELAANAVLHTARPFTIALRRGTDRVRVEAIDSAPELVPVASARSGIASDITGLSETGRGLLIASSLANRWGIELLAAVKSVWCEFDESGQPAVASEPVVHDERPTRPVVEGLNHLRFTWLPVRTAIASGFDVEDAIRDARALLLESDPLLDLVERSVTVRLAGRHAAIHAASKDEYRFDLNIDATDDALAATDALAALLAQRAGKRSGPSSAVIEFRAWLGHEIARQRAGEPPTECPLPDDS